MACLTVFSALVLNWCRVSQGVLLYQTTGRVDPGVENTIGYFAAVVYLQVKMFEGDDFAKLLERVTTAYCTAHSHADFSYLQTQTPRPEFTRNSIFNWIPEQPSVDVAGLQRMDSGLQCEPIPLESLAPGIIEFDSEPSILLFDTDRGIQGELFYPMSRFSDPTMTRFASRFVELVENILKHPEAPLADLL